MLPYTKNAISNPGSLIKHITGLTSGMKSYLFFAPSFHFARSTTGTQDFLENNKNKLKIQGVSGHNLQNLSESRPPRFRSAWMIRSGPFPLARGLILCFICAKKAPASLYPLLLGSCGGPLGGGIGGLPGSPSSVPSTQRNVQQAPWCHKMFCWRSGDPF